MTTAVLDALLAILVLAVWLGCLGFIRLRAPLDRMHCTAFINTTAGAALLLAALLSDGVSIRAGKILLVVATNLLVGAATSHALGRAILLRGSEPPSEPQCGRCK